MHCANEKDVKNGSSKVPSQQFILQQSFNLSASQNNELGDDEDEIWGDDWVVVNLEGRIKAHFQAEEDFSPAERADMIKRETISMKAS